MLPGIETEKLQRGEESGPPHPQPMSVPPAEMKCEPRGGPGLRNCPFIRCTSATEGDKETAAPAQPGAAAGAPSQASGAMAWSPRDPPLGSAALSV